MNELPGEIINHWRTSKKGYAQELSSLVDTGYPAWSIILPDGRFGVAVPYGERNRVFETFASVWIESLPVTNVSEGPVLVLASFDSSHAFASLCAEFVSPGADGRSRDALVENPVSWWKEWKGLLGNKNVDRRVYDVLGELVCLEALSNMGLDPVWGGPHGESCDIDCGSKKFEVKSTLSRNSKGAQIHGLFQLSDDGTEKFLVLAQFEPTVEGLSIDDMVDVLTGRGFSRAELNNALLDLGYPNGNSARTKCYSLRALTKYLVDDAFPHISSDSFAGGTLPLGVTSISYGISLDDVPGESMLELVRCADGGVE